MKKCLIFLIFICLTNLNHLYAQFPFHLEVEGNTQIIGYLDLNDGNRNVFIGTDVGISNTTGKNNTIVGYHALRFNKTGHGNTAVGYLALEKDSISSSNTAVGREALRNTSKGQNTAVGYLALTKNTTGFSNAASGYRALENNTTGTQNTAIGTYAMRVSTTGSNNTAAGNYALLDNTSGTGNTAVGASSLRANTTGNRNTAVGDYANSVSTTYTNTTGLGYSADCTASNQVRVGNSSVTSIGGYANWTNVSDARFKSVVKDDVKGLDFIKKLRPVTYNLQLDKIDDFFAKQYGVEKSEDEYTSNTEKSNIRYSGFLAQEVEQAAQQIGYDFSGIDAPKDEKDFYGLRYAEFVVPLVKGMQEQQEMLEKQGTEIAELKSMVKGLLVRLEDK